MKIKDDGKSFQVERVMHAKGNKRLGLLGMRERLEMVGGAFMSSPPGQRHHHPGPDSTRQGRAGGGESLMESR